MVDHLTQPVMDAGQRLEAGGLRGCPIWIAPEWVVDAAPTDRLDAGQWLARSAEAGLGSVLLIAKQCDGRCIWPTRLPALRTRHDFFGEMCRGAPSAGVQIYAYYSVALDSYQVELHPDWAFVDSAGRGCYDVGFTWACLNSPYGEFVMAQLEELLREYEIDALWLDMLALGPPDRDCYCVWCRQRYTAMTGGQLADILDSERAGVWKTEVLERFLTQVHALRDRYRPQALIAFNGAGAGFRRHPEAGLAGQRLFDLVDFLSDEGHEPHYESLIAKAMRAHGKPFEVLTSNGIANEWVGWVTKPSSLLNLEAAIVRAHGGAFGIGLSVLADGELPAGELAVVSQTARFVADRQPYFGPQRGMADVAFLIQPFRPTAPFTPPEQPPLGRRLPRGGGHHVPPLVDPAPVVNGLWDAAREAHLTTDLVHEHAPLAALDARVLVLQSSARLSDDLCAAIRAFVAAGGCLLVEGHASLLDEAGLRRSEFGLADVLGVHWSGYVGAWDGNYLALDDHPVLTSGLPTYPLQVAGPALAIALDADTDVLGWLVPPLGGEQTIDHHTASLFNPPSAATSRTPAITSHAFGQGRALYVSVALGEYLRGRRNVDPWAKRLASNLLGSLVPEPLLRTDAPAGVELLVNRAPDGRLLVHVLNNYVHSEYVTTDALPRLAEMRLELNERRLGSIARAWIAPPERCLPIDRSRPGWPTLALPPLDIHHVVVIERS